MTATRDPVSVQFDPLARRALNRCYKSPGRWQPVVLPPLTARVYVAWYARNIDLRERDPWDSNLNRYNRAFVRACFYQHKHYGDFDGLRTQRRTAPFEGFALVFDGGATLRGGRIRLMTAEKGDRRLPRKRPELGTTGIRNGVRVGGVGVGEAL
jgi:hypothetical protein